jgi:hypothetical protein
MSIRDEINSLTNRGLEAYMDNDEFMGFMFDEKDEYREYKNQEINEMKGK